MRKPSAEFWTGVLIAAAPVVLLFNCWNAPFLVAAALGAVGALSWLLVDPGGTLEPTESKAAAN